MMPVAAGTPLVELIADAYKANLPVLLIGMHGIGKSELMAQVAASLGIGLEIRDLSVMEPPDLVGIPQVGADGRTHYAAPSFLPTDGRGLLVFEELNRCPRYMQGPCLQLLTARRLNDYCLPEGWVPCAAINDGDGYMVEELDPALRSRFLQIRVVPDVREWVRWARGQQRVHPKVIEFVEHSPGIFTDPHANPRAWVYASQFLSTWEKGQRNEEVITVALAGLLGDKWALAFLKVYKNECHPLQARDVIEAYPAYRAAVRAWVSQGQLDIVAASLELLKRHLQPQPVYDTIVRDSAQKANLLTFLADLPGDLRRQVREWLRERGFTALLATK